MSYNELNFMRGFASAKKMKNTLNALNIAKKAHEGQVRRGSGEPYFYHPLSVANLLVGSGIEDDTIIATAIPHDALEDTATTVSELKAKGISDDVIVAVELVTKKRNFDKENDNAEYYANISKNEAATLVKIADRCHNLSTMGECWKPKKILKYIKETEDFVIPLMKEERWNYSDHLRSFFLMKTIIDGLVNSYKSFIARNINLEETE